jgi:hypothetical protein
MDNRNQAAKLAAVGGTAALLAAVAALLQRRKAAAAGGQGDVVIPDELIELIMAIAANSEATATATQTLITEIRNLVVDPQLTVKGWPPNTQRVRTIIVTCIQANIAYQADHLLVPDGMGLLIRSDPANAVGSRVRVATSRVEATMPDASYPLQPTEIVVWGIKDAHDVWVSSTAAGSIVIFSAEAE